MAIAPNSIIRLYAGIPLNNKYNDVIYFADVATRDGFFAGQSAVATLTPDSYQRVNSGKFKASVSADVLNNVNYMAFQNTNHGSKWFYAFVLRVNYINDVTCEVEYELDVMTTYFLDCTVNQSFVERQHAPTDGIGQNILPEPVALGEYVLDNYGALYPATIGSCMVVVAICDSDSQTASVDLFDGVVTGCSYYAYYLDDLGVLEDLLSNYITNPNSIVNMYMVPSYLVTGEGSISGQSAQSVFASPDFNGNDYERFGTYTPKNKKLFTYPYHYCHVDNANGQSLACRFELFDQFQPYFRLYGTLNFPVQIKLVPASYKGVSSAVGTQTESLTLDGYPMCSWNFDAYKAWLAQNSIPIETGLIAGLATAGIGIATGGIGIVAGVTAGIGTVADLVSRNYKASKEADICKGNNQAANVNFSNQLTTFYCGRARITEEYARVIDKFFDKYGYAYNRVSPINTHARPHWNYVKTVDACIVGSCPADALSKIIDIFDHGVTFWQTASEIGNYNLDNSPGGGT